MSSSNDLVKDLEEVINTNINGFTTTGLLSPFTEEIPPGKTILDGNKEEGPVTKEIN